MLRRTILLWTSCALQIGAFSFANRFSAKLVAEPASSRADLLRSGGGDR